MISMNYDFLNDIYISGYQIFIWVDPFRRSSLVSFLVEYVIKYKYVEYAF